MVKRAEDMVLEQRTNVRGGEGEAVFSHILSGEDLPGKCRLISTITLEPDASIGKHTHEGETEVYHILQGFAEWYMNLFVIKDTRFYGKRCMLWHSFTSHPKSDSYKFLSVARLNLYIKKQLKPILESYIEEPNIWTTWKNIYYEVKDIFTDLVDRRGISEWTWIGDQDAQSYSDLSINTEADVRAGKYHAQVKFKDIVTMQEITMDIITDASTGSIEINL